MDRKRVALVVVALTAVVAVAATVFADDSTELSAAAIDVPFVYMDGTEANLSDFAGTPIVVNFWASWCPACVAEMPDFQAVHADLGDQVIFLGLNMQETDPAGAEALVRATGVSYLLGADPRGEIFNHFGGIAMPTTVFIDADGQVVRTHAGVLFEADLDALIRSDLLGS